MRFFLGTHEPSWLWDGRSAGVPLFISHTRLRKRRTRFPRAEVAWALDSAGYTELTQHGRWSFGPAEYGEAVGRYQEEIGSLAWAAPQDWICTPGALEATGLPVEAHQERTVESFLELSAAGLPVVPVLQGWEPDDFHRCADLYAQAGVDLEAQPTVGVGSVAARSGTAKVETILSTLAGRGLRLHAFGLKVSGLRRCARDLESADSMSWSYEARKRPALAGCRHRSCQNCHLWALVWHERVLAAAAAQQLQLFAG